ncbi:MAG: hypothetical protein IPO88_21845 [Nannocystis sp.]|uniref:hypothetical protein n=1 Tax=Nannocystis sp. TaxID=1962667 RepID=UPI0024235F46|nr:hypothetical protein [Nannocystis sp.]MBK9756091.1 hypothetical protein [Nannocystis sp.]
MTSMPDKDELGGGLNYYFFGHNLKLQGDYFRSFTPGALNTGADLLRLGSRRRCDRRGDHE